jgi:hypothetical protein
MGGSPLGQSLPWRHPSPAKRARGHEVPVMRKNSYRADPKRTDDGASEPPPPWAAEVGPAQHHLSRSGVPHYRHARPGGTTDGDGTDEGERLAPPFRGNTDMGKREGHIIAGTCRGWRGRKCVSAVPREILCRQITTLNRPQQRSA